MPLDTESQLIQATKFWGLNMREATDYLATRGIAITPASYKKRLNEIEANAPRRLHAISLDFAPGHLEHVEKLDLLEMELWGQYRKKKQVVRMVDSENGKIPQIVEIDQDPVELTKILREIREIQPYKSAYREATRAVLESSSTSIPLEGVEVTEGNLDIPPA